MKQSKFVTKFTMLILLLVIVAYLIFSVLRTLHAPFSTALVYDYSVNDSVFTTGWIVRAEQVLPGISGAAEPAVADGSKVKAGQTVVTFYQNSQAIADQQAIRDLNEEIAQLEYAIGDTDAGLESSRLDSTIAAAIVKLRSAAASRAYVDADKLAQDLKCSVLRRECTYTEGAAAAAGQALNRCAEELRAVQSTLSGSSSQVYAPRSGIFISVADGYENVLTPDLLKDFSVGSFDALDQAQPEALPEFSVGKLVTSSTWYFTAPLTQEDARRLAALRQVSVAFPDLDEPILMKIEQISEPSDGRVAVVLSCTRSLAETSLLRHQTVELIFDRQDGLRIPARALRADPEGNTGVYVVSGANARWKPVKVLESGDDYYLIQTPPETGSQRRLHAGETVIVSAEDLYDGKVVAE